MPAYAYMCKVCKEQLTITRSVLNVETIPNCTKCEDKMYRIYEWSSTVFKGEGFYSTDKNDS